MVYGVILASGNRGVTESSPIPMQYQMVGKKPVLVHTVEKFLLCGEIDSILVMCDRERRETAESLLVKYLGRGMERIAVVFGGNTRNETIMRAIDYIEENGGLEDDTLIVTHDALRPFVTRRILEENINLGRKYGVVDTVIPATDTLVYSEDGEDIGSVPDRANMYQGQTPQTFLAEGLRECYRQLSREQRESLTDACKICLLLGKEVHMVQGEVFNSKITYPYDLQVARYLLRE